MGTAPLNPSYVLQRAIYMDARIKPGNDEE
jgi:hypothetical protein